MVMGKASTGAKAGLLSGLIYSAINAALAYYSVLRLKEFIISTIEENLPPNTPVSAEQAYNLALMMAPIGAFIFGLLLAVIIGAIFGFLYERLPGGRGVSKGVFMGVALWVISLILNLRSMYMPTIWFSLISGLILSLIYGVLLGGLYDRFVTPRP